MAIELNPDELNDYEFMTPAQAAEARKMQAELPLWQPVQDAPAAPPVQTGIDPAAGAPSVNLDGATLPGMDFAGMTLLPGTPEHTAFVGWMVQLALAAAEREHRQLNKTEGQESEA